MRIISGSNKGKKLILPKDKTTRPLKDIAKESVFNILVHAKYINFHLKINKNTFKIDQKFQIIFCDPPYKEKKIELLIKKIIEMDILEKDGIIIIHRKKGDLDNYPKKFKVIDKKSYGLSTFVFGKKSN